MTEREKLIELLVGDSSARCSFCEEFMTEMCSEHCSDYGTLRAAEKMTDYLLANGVTIPVRCKDCDFSSFWAGDGVMKSGKCFFLIGKNQYVTPDGYCGCGTRRADNG